MGSIDLRAGKHVTTKTKFNTTATVYELACKRASVKKLASIN